ncbi:trimeric intracellular cation channel family protein [Bacterioplanoides sp. SCSIO 12839]|uniref:trimeric intracellular cation channel family protein n=1 Tax=Bacterioplanoides sp. SCSIO 12839 TaxID=2829569 RepID=UPI0021084084|nr:trimeric intracellular cation channel family protein [Bacterioplanoides sp. SCSIO 12839]UTW48691.1 trimeric intracellular cation channel family protein [Bacterioplanoides sp. SCSIO 12839]
MNEFWQLLDQQHLTTDQVLYWSTLFASVFSAAAGVLDARGKQFDLFGVMIIAFCAALGGGTLRDVVLDRDVFWVYDDSYLIITWMAAIFTFYLARWIHLSSRWFMVPDAAALGLYTVAGTQAALSLEVSWLVASFMGVVTGVAGGILRDILLNEIPVVFHREHTLYATVAWLGSLILIGLHQAGISHTLSAGVTIGFIFFSRLAAIRWNLVLPEYREK